MSGQTGQDAVMSVMVDPNVPTSRTRTLMPCERPDGKCMSDDKCIERFEYLLKEYGLERDENLNEQSKALKEKVLNALPLAMRDIATKVVLLKSFIEDLRDTVQQYYPGEISEHYAYNNLLDKIDDISTQLESCHKPPVCKKCGKPFSQVDLHCFDHNGSDCDVRHDITSSDLIGGGKAYSVCTTCNWTGEGLTEGEMRETIACPHCGKFPFGDASSIEVSNPLDIMISDSDNAEGAENDGEEKGDGDAERA